MGFHYDNTYNVQGKYPKYANSQVENTPIVIVSFGDERVLHWERVEGKINNKGKIGWSKDNSFINKMVMNQCHIILLNCFDEKPHYITNFNTVVKYRHGNVCVDENETVIFILAFRVVQRYADYNYYNDTMITTINSDNIKEIIQHDARTKVYKVCDKHHHHALLKQMYQTMRRKNTYIHIK